MSDPPAPKPKPGSLRDRIAAFENKGATAPSVPPPAPRPKPGGVSWKPRPVSPPASPARPVSPGATETAAAARAGMSAVDAKESIGGGLSLKERMAALKGKGAFGAPGAGAAPAPPRPAGDKPKWKPPPRIASPPLAEAGEGKEPINPASPPADEAKSIISPLVDEAVQPLQSPPPAQDQPDVEGGPSEEDPEEEERKRRAAIAARMARLGGARVGMAPPIFGKKPDVKRRDSAQAEAKPAVTSPSEGEVAKEEKEASPQIPHFKSPKAEGIESTGGESIYQAPFRSYSASHDVYSDVQAEAEAKAPIVANPAVETGELHDARTLSQSSHNFP